MKIGVKVLPKAEVLDSQGRAVEQILKRHGKDLESCRVGRFIELNLKEENQKDALEKAKSIAEFVLHNPLIEVFELQVLE